MTNDIIELVKSQLDDRFAGAASRATGVDVNRTRTAIDAGVPALLAGIMSAVSSPSGVRAFGTALKNQDTSILSDPAALLEGDRQQSLIGSGVGMLESLIGERKLTSLVGALSSFAGFGQGQGRSLLGLLMPVVMAVLGREQRAAGGTDGVVRMLQSQRASIADAMPAGLASSLRSTGLLDALDETARPEARTASPTRTASTTARVPRRESHASRNWAIAAGLAALALVVWGLTRIGDDEPTREAADTTVATEPDTDVAVAPPVDSSSLIVGNVDVGEELNGIVDGVSDTLGGVTDAASARAALPRLSELNADLDTLMPMVQSLPDAARTNFGNLAARAYDRVQSEVERVETIPGVPDDVKQVISSLHDKLEGFATQRRA